MIQKLTRSKISVNGFDHKKIKNQQKPNVPTTLNFRAYDFFYRFCCCYFLVMRH
jgi:hypothetical protein